MVDLKSQYQKMSAEVNEAVLACLNSAAFIKGPPVAEFERSFAEYQGVNHVIGCGNGTDALQIALMALGLKAGDEVIVPAFTYIATAEVIALLGLKPIMVDVDPFTFNTTAELIEPAITEKTRAIVPVHLYGQCADMEGILSLAGAAGIPVIEDAAQATGTDFEFSDGKRKRAGTLGHIGCTSFFPTKNLGCYGDGGALMTDDPDLASRIRMIANHGQKRKYYHSVVGVNSRLDTIQAAILKIKLKHLDEHLAQRQRIAKLYDKSLKKLDGVVIPKRCPYSTHTFHQYTLKVRNGRRDALKDHLAKQGVPSVVYYPLPLHLQEAFRDFKPKTHSLKASEHLCHEVLSLPIHTEMDNSMVEVVCAAVAQFFS